MNNSIYRVCLDIHNTHAQTQLDISKGDNAREIEFTLTDGGAVYRIADDCTAIFRAQKPDGTVLYNNCEIVGDRIKYQLTSQTSADVGIVQCELQIIANEKLLTAPRFTLRVADTIYSDEEVESEDEFTALTEAIMEVGNIDVSVSKEGHTATVTVTDKDGVETSVEIYDGDPGTGSNVTATDSGGYLSKLVVDGTNHNVKQGSFVIATDAGGALSSLTVDGVTHALLYGSTVSGTSVSNKWTALTIDGVEKGLPGNVTTSELIQCKTGWTGSGTLLKAGFACKLSMYPTYGTGGAIAQIPSGYIDIFGVYGVAPIIRGSTGCVGMACLHIRSDGEMVVDYVYGTTLQQNDVLYITLNWVVSV